MSRSGTRATRLPALALVSALALLPAAYAANHGMLGGALRLASDVTGSLSTGSDASGAEATPGPSPSRRPAAQGSARAASTARRTPTTPTIRASRTASALSTTRDRVQAAGVVPVPGPPGAPAPPPYPWQGWSWATATANSGSQCMPRFGPGTQPHMTVTTKQNTATATWMHNGDPAVRAFWLGRHLDMGTPAQRNAPIEWMKVAVPTGCTPVTATLPKLESGHYRLWMEMDVFTPELVGISVSRVGLSQTTFDIP